MLFLSAIIAAAEIEEVYGSSNALSVLYVNAMCSIIERKQQYTYVYACLYTPRTTLDINILFGWLKHFLQMV